MSGNSSSSSLGSIGSIGSFDSMDSTTSAGRRRGKRIAGGYSCPHPGCEKVFDVPSKMRHHERNHINRPDRPHVCGACTERFLFPKDLKRHLTRIHGTGMQRSESDVSGSVSIHHASDTTTETSGFESNAIADEFSINKTASKQSPSSDGKSRFRWKPRLPPIPRDPGGKI